METAIRWSSHSTLSDQHFLHVDVTGRKLRLCRLTSPAVSKPQYETIATHSRVPAFRAFDWSPATPALVAVGQSSGEATVLRIDDGSDATLSFPIRSQRLCNAVALNREGLLAAGLDKVRNDFCLNIWDLNQRVPSIAASGSKGFGNDKGHVDPYAKLASSEPITSIKFFADQPQTLVAGVKAQFVRLYDLREPHGQTALQFPTRCVHNLAIDPCDENYIASCTPQNDATVCVWDRRAGSRPGTTSAMSFGSDPGPQGSSLELKNISDVQGSIWSLRFARTRRGCLGMLTSTGQLKVLDIGKEQIKDEEGRDKDGGLGNEWTSQQQEGIYVDRMQEVERPYHKPKAFRQEKQRIVSFDFITHDDHLRAPGTITLTADKSIEISGVGYGKRASSFSPFPLPIASAPSPHDHVKPDSSMPLSRRLAIEKKTTEPAVREMPLTKSPLNPMCVFRRRCERGYQFDTAKNRTIIQEDTELLNFWRNIERATSLTKSSALIDDELDYSYLGVHGIWMDMVDAPTRRVNPGPRTRKAAQTTEGLAKSLDLPMLHPAPKTSYTAHRQLCLYISGLQRTPAELENEVRRLAKHNQLTKAAARALFGSEPKLATRALRQKSSIEMHKMLAMAVSSSQSRDKRLRRRNTVTSSDETDDSDSEWKETLSSLQSSVPSEKEDPYAHAIINAIVNGTPAHSSNLLNSTLPLADKLYIALHHLPDNELTTYLSKITKSYVSQGKLDGILLTGLGSVGMMKLLSKYIARTGDVQSAVLALAAVIPRYISDPEATRRFEAWREEYRIYMQTWDLIFQRVKFDVQGHKLAVSRAGVPLLPPAKTQVSISCTYCQQSVNQIAAPAKPGFSPDDSGAASDNASIATAPAALDTAVTKAERGTPVPTTISTTRTPKNHPLASTKSAAVGTICPKCGRSLPRCGICELPLGAPDSSYIKPLNMTLSSTTNGTISKPPPTTTTAPSASGPMSKKGSTTTQPDPEPPINPGQATTPELDENTLLSKFITFCLSCGHGHHAIHAREWFGDDGKRKTCPVGDCGCICWRAYH